jgi:hypothetical protein
MTIGVPRSLMIAFAARGSSVINFARRAASRTAYTRPGVHPSPMCSAMSFAVSPCVR